MPKKILLADDSLTIQKVVELTFSEADYDVSVVGDGAQAIERIEADPPDIVLADVMMPKKTGYEVCEHIKASPRLAHIPVLLLVGKFEPFDQQRAKSVGAQGHILKPFESNVLVRSVGEMLAAAAPPAAPAAAVAPAAPAAPRRVEDASSRTMMMPEAVAPAMGAAAHPPAASTAPTPPNGFSIPEEASPFSTDVPPLAADEPAAASDPIWSTPTTELRAAAGTSVTAQVERPADLQAALAADDAFAAAAAAQPGSGFAESDAPFGSAEPVESFADAPYREAAPFGEEPMAEQPAAASRSGAETRPGTRPIARVAAAATPATATSEAGAPSLDLDGLPDHVLDAIAERVVRRLSDDAVRDIAWQVVPELAELLIKKKLEELG